MQDELGYHVNGRWGDGQGGNVHGVFQAQEEEWAHLQQFAQDPGFAHEESEVGQLGIGQHTHQFRGQWFTHNHWPLCNYLDSKALLSMFESIDKEM